MANIKIKTQFLTLFMIIGLIPLVVVGGLFYFQARKTLLDRSYNHISTIQEMRKRELEEDMHKRLDNLYNLINALEFKSLTRELNIHFKTGQGNLNSNSYNEIISLYRNFFGSYLDSNSFHNVYILPMDEPEVYYNFRGEQGFIESSGLIRAWKKAVANDSTAFEDFSEFNPSLNIQSAFMAKAYRDSQGNKIGVVVLQLTADFIDDLLKSREGMGRTGESYLISYEPDKSRYEFRSELHTMGQGKYKIGVHWTDPLDYWVDAVAKGTKGGSGLYVDSIGNEVLVDFNKLNIPGINWYLISKINTQEVTEDLISIINKMLIVSAFIFMFIIILSFIFSGKLTYPIIQGVEFARSISKGDFDRNLDINRADELGILAKALKDMGKSLKEQAWLQMGKEGLDDALRGEHDIRELGNKFMSFMVKHLDAQLGALYLLEDDGDLHLTSSYAFSDREGAFQTFSLGEGLVGQAALDRDELEYTHVPFDTPGFNYGVSSMIPTSYIATPLLFEEELIGVFLIGITVPVTTLQKKFIEVIKDNISILINGAKANTIIQDLLEEAQEQQEALRASNEELEQQAEALRDSEKDLQAQQEELRVTNEELEERTDALEAQKHIMRDKNRELESIGRDLESKARDLERASKYKSEFLANMSHELRTPLNSILILSQLIANNKLGNLNEKQVKSAEAINSSGEDLLKLINEILDLSKVEAGKIDINREIMTISSLIEDLERVYRPTAEHKGTEFIIKRDESLPQSIVTDSHRLQQIIKNLLTNALKFTDKNGQVILSINKNNEYIEFAVEDNGIGIPKDKQAAIFEAFQQADGSTSRKYGGTGLGLSISRELVKLLGGEIKLESEEGKGSTFTVTLPIVESSVKEISEVPKVVKEDKQREAHVHDDREGIQRETKTLLIIEDDISFASILKEQAHDRGYKVLIAEDGETGLHFADYYRPCAIILDIGLPGIDGWGVMDRLKNDPELRHIPVHFTSGRDQKIPALKMGAVGYMMKPVTLEGLKGAFEKIESIISTDVSKLLIVEDDEIQRESIRALIDFKNLSITDVATGEDAYKEMEKINFDCVILDLGLQDMSGYDLLDKIRKNEKMSGTPIIIYTGRDLSVDEEQMLSSYAESIIIKGAKSPERLLEESSLFLHRVDEDLPESQKNLLSKFTTREDVLSGKKILLVDDDMRNVFALSNILEDKDVDIIVARDGIESLDAIEKNDDIDLVLMDIMMPRMDGYEAMKEIRKSRDKNSLPIIALTANAMKGDRNKCIKAGANDYLAKPVDNDKLVSMLRVWLY